MNYFLFMVILNKFSVFLFISFLSFFLLAIQLFQDISKIHKYTIWIFLRLRKIFLCAWVHEICSVVFFSSYFYTSFLSFFFLVPGSMNCFPFYCYLKQVSFFFFPLFFFFLFFSQFDKSFKDISQINNLEMFCSTQNIRVCLGPWNIFRLFSLVISYKFSFFRQGIKTLPFVHFLSLFFFLFK